MSTPLISVISPVYGAEKIVDELVKRIVEHVTRITDNYEIILVDDCGPDDSWLKIEENCNRNTRVKGIKLSRNFGQHYAITAGLDASKGDFVIIMDCDLQDDPGSIKLIIEELKNGNDVVFTKRQQRSHSLSKAILSKLYNKAIRLLADSRYDIDAGSMLGASRKAVTAFLHMKDKDRLYVQLFKWIGFSQTYIEVPHNQRFSGESTYTFSKMLKLALQGLTSHSNRLLYTSIYLGFGIALLSFISGLFIILLYFTINFYPGWTSLFVAISFATGLILMSNGILGIYIGKSFEQSKQRPLYLVDKHLNL